MGAWARGIQPLLLAGITGLSGLAWAPSSLAADWQVAVERDVYAWAGPMAVAGLIDNWSGSFEDGDDGLLWLQDKISAGYGPVVVSYVHRHHAEYELSNQLAKGFYYQANGIQLEQPYSVTDRVRARHYEGEGISLAWQFESALPGQWSITPSVTQLQLYRFLWGEVSGTLNYQDDDNWGGDLYVDYAYTEDKIPPARTLDQRSYGDLYSLDLALHWAWRSYQLDYQGYNLLARIDWSELPVTFGSKNWQYIDGQLTADGDFPVMQREGEVFRVMRPPRFHQLHQALALTPELDLTLDSYLNGIRNGHEMGLAWQPHSIRWQIGFEPRAKAVRLALQHRWLQLGVLSDSLDISQSQLLALQLGLGVRF
ncbi:hypothetical protein [Oceanobacter mangrovi]|uniref:hypothetical protein n=1 Tax=Oceanobacter mangrovi TaxID=2862510 RepID=UPI001C8E69ED|nr:hypothetical protein [Oceanobacter mangrovi]